MIDQTTRKRLTVTPVQNSRPYIRVPMDQLEAVRQLLDTNQIRYWVDEIAVSLDDEPEVIVVNLGWECDAKVVQQILDRAP